MGTVNKRHNRKITRPCPVCGGKVVVCHNNAWWVACEATNQVCVRNHIPQLLVFSAKEAIEIWNRYGNELTNGQKIRRMSDYELAEEFAKAYMSGTELEPNDEDFQSAVRICLEWIKEPVKDGDL